MQVHEERENEGGKLHQVSLWLLVGAVASGMLLGSGASTTARAVFQLLAAAAFVFCALSMIAEGRWRFVRSPLILAPILFAAVAACQLWPLTGESVSFLKPRWSPDATETFVVSADPHSTVEAVIWWASVVAVVFVTAVQCRSRRDVRTAVTMLAVVLAASGVAGVLLSVVGEQKAFGLIDQHSPGTHAFLRDAYQTTSSIGIAGASGWEATPQSDSAVVPFYRRQTSARPLFAGFLDAEHWMACAAAVLPALLMASVGLFHELAHRLDDSWTGLSAAQRGTCTLGLACVLSALLTYVAAPFVAVAFIALGVLTALAFAGASVRWQTLGCGLLLVVVSGSVVAFRYTTSIPEQMHQWLGALRQNNAALTELWRDHFWLGCGVGAVGEVWPHYQSHAGKGGGSALLIVGAESGVVGLAVLLLAAAYIFLRLLWVQRSMDDLQRVQTAGVFAGLTALAATAVVGSGASVPAAVGVGALLFGVVARDLAIRRRPLPMGGPS